MSLLQNPIAIGLISAVLTYLYLWYTAEQQYKNNPSMPKRKISLVAPGTIGVLLWFIASTYFDMNSNSDNPTASLLEQPVTVNNNDLSTVDNYKLVKSGGSDSYQLIGTNMVKLPKTDVFIDLAAF